MTVQPISDPKTPIGEILKAAGSEGMLLDSEGQGRYALIPLDDELIDYLIERSPKFRADCREVRGAWTLVGSRCMRRSETNSRGMILEHLSYSVRTGIGAIKVFAASAPLHQNGLLNHPCVTANFSGILYTNSNVSPLESPT